MERHPDTLDHSPDNIRAKADRCIIASHRLDDMFDELQGAANLLNDWASLREGVSLVDVDGKFYPLEGNDPMDLEPEKFVPSDAVRQAMNEVEPTIAANALNGVANLMNHGASFCEASSMVVNQMIRYAWMLAEEGAMSEHIQPNPERFRKIVDDHLPPKTMLADGSPVTDDHREIDPYTGMQKAYVVLSEDERSKGFVRPVRTSYVHDKCGVVTTMGRRIAETYARDPEFYSATYCVGCKDHFPVEEFTWSNTDGERVGS